MPCNHSFAVGLHTVSPHYSVILTPAAERTAVSQRYSVIPTPAVESTLAAPRYSVIPKNIFASALVEHSRSSETLCFYQE
jgi:hypothetical protein